LRKRWREATLADTAEHVAREVERITQLEREYQEAWTVSQQDRVSKRTSAGRRRAPLNLLAETRTEKRDGNPKFLDGVRACIQLRCRLLGLLDKDSPDQRPTTAQVLVIEPKLAFDPPVAEEQQPSGSGHVASG